MGNLVETQAMPPTPIAPPACTGEGAEGLGAEPVPQLLVLPASPPSMPPAPSGTQLPLASPWLMRCERRQAQLWGLSW